MELGLVLEGARTRQALSQGALAALLGVSQQTVSRWETGLSRPRATMLRKLASVLNLSQEELGVGAGGTRSTRAIISPPIRPLTHVLPLTGLSPFDFERFTADLLERRFPG